MKHGRASCGSFAKPRLGHNPIRWFCAQSGFGGFDMRTWLTALILVATLIGSEPVFAQDPHPDREEDRVEDIVVTARRAGAPMWTVERGDSTVILVGSIRGLPRDFEWRPEALEDATRQADRILYPPVGSASLSDVARLFWRFRTIASLPNDTTTADHLPANLQARLDALMAGERNDAWRRRSFLLLSDDLMEQAGWRRGGRDAEDVVRGTARRAQIEGQSVGFVRGDEIVENLISQPPSAYQPCMAASIAAAEGGNGLFAQRADDWRALRVMAVVENPLEVALGQCWPWGDPTIGPQLRGHWLAALSTALDEPGVTLAVAPIRLLAERGGVLDGLEAQGLDVRGPDWKVEP